MMWRLRPVLKTLCQCPWQTRTSISKLLEWRPNMWMLHSRKWRNVKFSKRTIIYYLQQWGSWYLNKPWEDTEWNHFRWYFKCISSISKYLNGELNPRASQLTFTLALFFTPRLPPRCLSMKLTLLMKNLCLYLWLFFLLVDLLLPRKRQRQQCRSPPLELKSVLLWLASYRINWLEFVESALWLPVKSVECQYLPIIL